MKHLSTIPLAAVCAAALLAVSCTRVDFNNPLDPKGTDYLYGNKACEREKITDSAEGAGLFTNPELMRCGDGTTR